jgi:thiosulfate dehydrogenase
LAKFVLQGQIDTDTIINSSGAFTGNATTGQTLYDKFWAVSGVTASEPTTDHALWALRPDTSSNTRTGSDTWRCKECHGWDYKGVLGAYATGSHRTGIAGIFGTTKTAQEVFDLIKTNHSYGTAGLSDADIWDLAKFVLQGQIDTDTIINSSGAFTGNATTGQTLYDNMVPTGSLFRPADRLVSTIG